jgi:hypothetical protein
VAELVRETRSDPEARRFNHQAIEASLRALQQDFPRINPQLKDRRDPLGDDVVRNLLAGYGFIDDLLARRIDPFAMGSLKYLLELNCLVLCGRDSGERERLAEHIQATEARFYDQTSGGVRDIVEWHARHRRSSVWERAAGVYIRVLSEPQLYIEGNHRTGTLIMSFILGREGRPPVVITSDTAQAFFDPSSLVKQTRKGSVGMLFRMPGLKKRLARFLEQHADDAYFAAAPTGITARCAAPAAPAAHRPLAARPEAGSETARASRPRPGS